MCGTADFVGQPKSTVEFCGAEWPVTVGHGDEHLTVQLYLVQRHVVVERREAVRVTARITVHKRSPPGGTTVYM